MVSLFALQWMEGSVRPTPSALALLQSLVAEVPPSPAAEPQKPRQLPRSFRPVTERSTNPYGVTQDQVWESLEPRHRAVGRQVRVVAVGDAKAVVENLQTGTRSCVLLTSFSGKGSKGYKLVPVSTPSVQLELN